MYLTNEIQLVKDCYTLNGYFRKSITSEVLNLIDQYDMESLFCALVELYIGGSVMVRKGYVLENMS